jgi:hypothetical protein
LNTIYIIEGRANVIDLAETVARMKSERADPNSSRLGPMVATNNSEPTGRDDGAKLSGRNDRKGIRT